MSFDRPRLATAAADVLSTANLTPVSHQPLTTAVVGLGQASQSLLFVDRSVADYQQLLAGIAPGTEVHILDSSQDAIAQITNTLLGRHNISSLHIVSHGEAGGLDFGSSRLNLQDLPEYAAQLQSWSKALTDDADLLLYGCDVAQGELGKAFVQILSQWTGADVAASDDLTGNVILGGDWELEFKAGAVEADLAFQSETTQRYTATLDATYHNLAGGIFSQDWLNPGLITANDDWSGVPSIIGYLGQDLTTLTGTNPQTILTPNSAIPNDPDVIANQTNPNTLTSSGVAEFQISNPTVALQGSGTADAPYLLIHLNTTGVVTPIAMSYNLRDIDGSADNAIQPVALQYRVGTTGNFTNVPAAYVADASTGPSLATLVTPVNATLPAEVNNQAQVQLRIMTTNATGSDEWIGIDDIQITSTVASLPTVSLNTSTANITEGSAGNFTIARTDTTGALTINLTIDATSTAVLGSSNDYTLDVGGTAVMVTGNTLSLTIADTQSSVTLNMAALAEAIGFAEAADLLKLNLAAGTGYSIGSNNTATITIAQNGFIVTTTSDTGEGSLRQAVANANAISGADTITFAGSTFTDATPDTITLASELTINDDVTIQGTGANRLTVAGAGTSSFNSFIVNSGVTASFDGLTISNSNIGINNFGGTIASVSNSTFSGNNIGISNRGTSTSLSNSTFSSNVFAGISNSSGTIALVSNSTFSGSTYGISNDGTLSTLVNNTITGNGTTGILNSGTGTIANLYNNLLVSNGNNTLPTATNFGNNLTGTFVTLSVDSTLRNNGGTTQTYALLPGSAAINAGTSTGAPTTDQRGISRVGAVDIGAFESRGFTIAAVSGSGQSTNTGTSFTNPLVVSVSSAFSEPVNGGTVTFTAPGSGASTNLAITTATIASGQTSANETANATGGTYTVTANTLGNLGSAINFSLMNIPPNAAPVVTVAGTPLSYTENDPATLIDSTATVADTDSTNFDTGTLTVNYSANGSVDDRLAIRNQGTSTEQIGVLGSTVSYEGTTIGTFTGGTGTTALVITFNANATPTAISALLRNLTYTNVSEAPSTAARTMQFVVTDGDGGTSTAVTKTINVTAVNDVPTIALPGGTVSYTENAIATLIDGTATITDLDATNFNTGNLTINYTAGGTDDDRLTIRNQGTGTGQISLDGRTVKFEGAAIGTYTGGIGTTPLVIAFNSTSATPAAAQALLQAIAFSNVSQNPTTTARSLQVTVSDGTSTSTPATRIINVTAVNDAPIVGTTTVLYNGASGALPSSAQGWLYGGPGVTPTVSNGATNLNTTANPGFAAGFSNSSVILDRTAGYVVSFNAQVVSESRTATADKDLDGKDDRAGFSIIVVSSDNTKAIELGFLSDRIFAQEDGTNQVDPSLQPDTTTPNATRTLFTQAEAAAFTTTAATNYDLAIKDDTYTLFANNTVILSGRLRDYTGFSGTPDPYQVPNQIFFGDDTTSAAANLNLSRVAVTTNPATPPSQTVNEDTAIVLPNLLLTDLDAGSNPITLTLGVTNGTVTVNNVSGSTLSNNGTATVTVTGTLNQISAILTNATGISYQGNANYNGADTLTLSLNDNGASGGSAITTTKTLPITVNSVNDVPSFTKGADQTINEDAAAQTISSWATNLSPGAANESSQTLNFLVSNDNNVLFAVQPTLDATGKLTYTAAANANGTATVSVRLQDNGGTAPGVDTSAAQTFTITVNPVNDAPSFTKGADQTVNEDAGPQTLAWATNLSPGATNETSQTLNFLVSNSNTALFAAQPTLDAAGNLTYTSAPNASGTATVTVQLKDNGGVTNNGSDTSAAQTFTITVNAVNDAPTLTGNATLSAVTQNATNPSGGTITSLFGSLFSDIDTGASLSGLAIVGNLASPNTQGQWQYALDGTTWFGIGLVNDGTNALALAASTRVRFVPVTGYNGTPSGLTVRALDNTYSGGFTTNGNRLVVDTTTNGGSSAIAGGTPTALTTSVVPLLPQLVWRNSGTGQNAVWQLNNFTVPTSYFLPTLTDPNWQIAATTADFNQDGFVDLLWRNQRTGANAIWELNSTGYQTSYLITPIADLNWQIAGTADFNGDGIPDILWRNAASGQNSVWQQRGATLQSNYLLPTLAEAGWQLVATTADFNQDGVTDLLWRNQRTGANAIWQMSRTGYQTSAFITPVADTNWQIMGTGDFNRDGTADIVWRNKASGDNAIWQMQGATLQSGFLLPTVADANWQIAGVADLGGDSTPELLWRNKPAGQAVIWQLNGFSYTTTTTLPNLTDPNWSVKPFVAPLNPIASA